MPAVGLIICYVSVAISSTKPLMYVPPRGALKSVRQLPRSLCSRSTYSDDWRTIPPDWKITLASCFYHMNITLMSVSCITNLFGNTEILFFFPPFGLCKEGASFGLSNYKNTVLNSKMLPKVKVIKWLWLTELKRKLKEETERRKTVFLFCWLLHPPPPPTFVTHIT